MSFTLVILSIFIVQFVAIKFFNKLVLRLGVEYKDLLLHPFFGFIPILSLFIIGALLVAIVIDYPFPKGSVINRIEKMFHYTAKKDNWTD